MVWWGTRQPKIALVRSECKGKDIGKKIPVAYASRAGSTGEIANAIAKRLCAEGFDVDVREVSSLAALDNYAAIVIGSAVRYGAWLPEIQKFMQRHKQALAQRPLAYFTACNKARDQSAASIAGMKEYSKAAHEIAQPKSDAFFAGKLDAATLSLFDRMVVRMIGSPMGDFRDWAAIDAWAKSLVPLFKDLA